MSSSPWYVVAGFLIVAVIALGLVSGYTFAFSKILKIKMSRIWSKLLLATVVWLFSTIAAVMFVSGWGVLPFVIILTLLFAVLGFLLAFKAFGLNLRQAIFYSLGFSVIINPVWYFLFTG